MIIPSCTDSLVVKDPTSDAGGPRFESHAGRVTGKPTPSLWRDKHPAIKGLRPPEHHAGKFRQDQKDSSESKKKMLIQDLTAEIEQASQDSTEKTETKAAKLEAKAKACVCSHCIYIYVQYYIYIY